MMPASGALGLYSMPSSSATPLIGWNEMVRCLELVAGASTTRPPHSPRSGVAAVFLVGGGAAGTGVGVMQSIQPDQHDTASS
eukprot:4552990-Prymnesium_polylepis.1